MYSLRVAPSFSRNKVKCFCFVLPMILEDYAKVDQMPILEGKRMTIQLSPKRKKPKKPATAGAPKPAAPAQKAEKPETGEE